MAIGCITDKILNFFSIFVYVLAKIKILIRILQIKDVVTISKINANKNCSILNKYVSKKAKDTSTFINPKKQESTLNKIH